MNRINPKVSVRMSAYNHEKYVEQAILSIVNQTYQDFELLVINDGSTDGTPEIIERLSKEHGFYYESQKNMGVTRTLNKLIRMSNGEYITGCASDDYWPPTRLEEQVKYLNENPEIDLVHGVPMSVNENSEVISEFRISAENLIGGCGAYLDLLRAKRSFYTGTLMVRKMVYRKVGDYDESIAVEDVDWMLRVARQCRIQGVNNQWIYYRQHGENWTATASGISRILKSERQVLVKQGFIHGSVFLYYRLPFWFMFEIRSNSFSRFLYLLLVPFYIFHKKYLYYCLVATLGKVRSQKVFEYLFRK